MATPKYKLPELIAGSLQMQAYNDRLAFLDALIAEIPITEELDAHNLSTMQNNKAQLVSALPTQTASNWYQDKASNLHLQVEGMAKFLSYNQRFRSQSRFKQAKYGVPSFILEETSSQNITYTSATSTTIVDEPCHTNFLTGATVDNYAVFKVDPLIKGVITVVNAGTVSTNLCLNDTLANGGFCSIISVGQVRKFVVLNGLINQLS